MSKVNGVSWTMSRLVLKLYFPVLILLLFIPASIQLVSKNLFMNLIWLKYDFYVNFALLRTAILLLYFFLLKYPKNGKCICAKFEIWIYFFRQHTDLKCNLHQNIFVLSIHFILTHFRIKIHFMSIHLLFKLVLFVYIHDMSKWLNQSGPILNSYYNTGLPTKNETLKTNQDMTIVSLIFLHLIEFLDGLLNNK